MVTQFLAAPVPRAHEAVADAMQAMGVFLFKDTEELIEGERTQERVGVLGLPGGDEAIRAELAALNQDGKAGTQVRVETRRGNNKKGAPKHMWSAAVLDQAACLLGLLSLDDPLRRPQTGPADGPEVQIADATPIAVRSRRFFFDTELKLHKLVPFETAEDVVISNSIVIPAGSLVTASMEQVSDIGEFGRGAKGQVRFKYLTLPDGARLTLRGILDLRGKGAKLNKLEKGILIAGSVATRTDFASGTGSGFAVPAGTLFHAEVDGEQKFRVRRATADNFSVLVNNPAPGGGTSNAVGFTVLTPEQATQAIINTVNALFSQGVLNGGQDNSLVGQLQHAITMMNAGKNAGAIGNLDSFVSEVNDLLSSGVLSPSQAASLINAVQAVIAPLS